MADIKFDSERIIRFFRSKYSDEESSYINSLFCDRDKEEELKQFLRKHWHELFQEEIKDDKNLDHILYRIHYGINMKSEKTKRTNPLGNFIKWFSRVAAILIFPLAIYSAINFLETVKEGDMSWVEIKAPAWTRTQFSLPDGTTGWLSSNSSVRYDVDFSRTRHVTLSGEAFFDVAKDVRRPFQVKADEMIVTVSGTRFNIASYDNENIVEVVLEEGEVICYNKAINKSLTLKPNDYLLFDKIQNNFKVETVQAEKYSSWKEGKLVFRNDALEVIARRLERWYNIEVEVRGEITNHNGLWATFVDENLEEVLRLLKLSLPVNYGIEYPQLRPDGIFSKTKVIITRIK